jgi:hypothetical protein
MPTQLPLMLLEKKPILLLQKNPSQALNPMTQNQHLMLLKKKKSIKLLERNQDQAYCCWKNTSTSTSLPSLVKTSAVRLDFCFPSPFACLPHRDLVGFNTLPSFLL